MSELRAEFFVAGLEEEVDDLKGQLNLLEKPHKRLEEAINGLIKQLDKVETLDKLDLIAKLDKALIQVATKSM